MSQNNPDPEKPTPGGWRCTYCADNGIIKTPVAVLVGWSTQTLEELSWRTAPCPQQGCIIAVTELENWQTQHQCICQYGWLTVQIHNRTQYMPCPDCSEGIKISEMLARAKRELKYQLANLVVKSGGLVGELTKLRFENFKTGSYERIGALQEAQSACKKGTSLLITGAKGSGKTHLAAAYCNGASANRKEAVFLTMPGLMDSLNLAKEEKHPHELSEEQMVDILLNIDILVLEDLGTEPIDAWSFSRLFSLLNGRINRGTPTLVTTSFTIPELAERGYDERVIDRLKRYTQINLSKEDIA
ncbi:ATP-binding protein (plasmid) [Candidatus Chlorohelix allophototropha]|uniref:ATP-binding protein n=1 Tax=Candidatus Chlorohelix allophototropha TaxID=3003348 RepID=A0ABY9BAV8_9CHLR|nr:ATP-binding protein [Chloroflexota bacterium L227-S17]